MGLRRRIENSDLLAGLIARGLAGYLRLSFRSMSWQIEGRDAFEQAARSGPVVLVMWHSRILLAPAIVKPTGARLVTLRDPSPMGRVSGAVQQRFGFLSLAMSAAASNRATSKAIMRQLRDGYGIALTADGPTGPARVLKAPPLEWARISGAPVFTFAFSTSRQRRLNSWDRMLFPRLFGRGAAVFTRWDREVPRKPSEAELADLTEALTGALNQTQAQADALLDLPPGP